MTENPKKNCYCSWCDKKATHKIAIKNNTVMGEINTETFLCKDHLGAIQGTPLVTISKIEN